MPLTDFIEHLYFERFGKERPDVVLSIEEKVRLKRQKQVQRREEKRLRQETDSGRTEQLELRFISSLN